jgi:hypothetical protein
VGCVLSIIDNELEVNSTSRAPSQRGRLGSQWAQPSFRGPVSFEPTKCAYQPRKTWWLGEEKKRAAIFSLSTCEPAKCLY